MTQRGKVIYNFPKGTMKFVLNSSIDTLPTLFMWERADIEPYIELVH